MQGNIPQEFQDFLHAPSRLSPAGTKRKAARPPAPSHRHGTPSGPWPWIDIDDEVDQAQVEDPDAHLPMSGAPCEHDVSGEGYCWCKYPQSLYPNWTPRQQRKSKIKQLITKSRKRCFVFYVDVGNDGRFQSVGPPKQVDARSLDSLSAQWNLMKSERPESSRARVIFIDNLTGPILQMLGAKYNIEPFFFSSTIGWIPSRFQSHVKSNCGDHVTITLSFIRGTREPPPEPSTEPPTAHSSVYSFQSQISGRSRATRPPDDLMIDTQAPLPLRSSSVILLPDFLSLHMVRSLDNSTIISSHSGRDYLTTTAEVMHERFLLTGKSVYWSSIFERTKDATFLLLSILWYVMYCWDEVFEALYNHTCALEASAMETNELQLHLTRELHAIRAHLMHYESLLEDFRKAVEFVQNTPNPGLDNPKVSEDDRVTTRSLIKRECGNLLRDIARLERSRIMQDKRLKNVMDLSFSLINIGDSKRMQKLTEAAVKDSAAMKQIAYLTMVFLPSSFVAAAFGMNIVEINPEGSAPSMTLAKYFAVALPLTFVTIWVVIAFQIKIEEPRISLTEKVAGALPREQTWQSEVAQTLRGKKYRKLGVFSRLLWPFLLGKSMMERKKFVEKARTASLRSIHTLH